LNDMEECIQLLLTGDSFISSNILLFDKWHRLDHQLGMAFCPNA